MKTWKKFAFMAIVAIFVIIIGITACDLITNDGDDVSDFEYSEGGSTITITKYKGNGGSVNIPANIKGKPVSSIGTYAFLDCKSITSVTIPNGVTSIGHGAFFSCHSLVSVTIPNTVTSIDVAAFQNCHSLASVTIPSSLASIESWAFADCESLISVTFVGTIASSGFKYGNSFLGDLRAKYLTGGIGTYSTTAPVGSSSV